ncbi:MCE family protein [Mycolicibacterium sp.]|uniref:MCE family protein n=1 Tax=Mycolicibacterium sp. TaxID=2320850 RepID=UPI003D122A59
MSNSTRGAAVRLTVFVITCLCTTFAVLAVFGQFRFGDGAGYRAVFRDVTGLKPGDFVRIAGVEVGKVGTMTYQADSTVLVEFSAQTNVPLTEGTRALVRYQDVVGDRYLELAEGPGSPRQMQPGATIPLARTAPALDLDALLGGFQPLFRAMDPEQVNALSGQLIRVLQGQGNAIGSFLSQTATLTSTLADRDALIGQVIDNLNAVIGTFGDQSDQIDSAIDSLAQVVTALEGQKVDVTNAVGYGNAAAASIADLLQQARPPVQNTIHHTERVGDIVLADHEYMENLIDTLPDAYRALSRQGVYGDYFSFYLCDIMFKLNGKGGQPVYVKVVSQVSGRCTPK